MGCNNVRIEIIRTTVDPNGCFEWNNVGIFSPIWKSGYNSMCCLAAELRTLGLQKASTLPTDIELCSISFSKSNDVSHETLWREQLAYDYITKQLYCYRDGEWYYVEENGKLNDYITSAISIDQYSSPWRGQSTYVGEEFAEVDYQSATFRYNLYWKQTNSPSQEKHNLRVDNFKNTDKCIIRGADDAVRLAALELGYESPIATVLYDDISGYYMVELYNDDGVAIPNDIQSINEYCAMLYENVMTVIIDNNGKTVEIYRSVTYFTPFICQKVHCE